MSLPAQKDVKAKLKQLGYDGESVSNMDAMTARMFLAAMKGNVNAYRALMEYGEMTPEAKRAAEKWEVDKKIKEKAAAKCDPLDNLTLEQLISIADMGKN